MDVFCALADPSKHSLYKGISFWIGVEYHPHVPVVMGASPYSAREDFELELVFGMGILYGNRIEITASQHS